MKIHPHLIVFWCYVSTIILLPFSRLSEFPILILAILGIYSLFKRKEILFDDQRFKVLSIIYLCYLALILISSLDSYWQDKSLIVGFASLRFYLASVAMIGFLKPKQFNWLILASAIICIFWSIDALIQYLFGVNLIGLSSYPGRLNGIFGEGHAKLGPVLALLFPCLLIQLISASKPIKWALTLLVGIVILLSGTRSAWLMFFFVLFAFFVSHIKANKWWLLAKTSVITMILSVGLWYVSSDFQQRVDRTLKAFDGSTESLEFALADRLSIWQVSVEMIKEHPINGVGAHAFREAYSKFATENDAWQQQGGVGMHAHHWLLEVLADTGLIGLCLFFVAIVSLFKYIKKQKYTNELWVYTVALSSAFLPIISTYSIFASFWSICIWLIGSALITVGVSNE